MCDVRLTCVAFPPSLKLKLKLGQDLTLAADAVGAAGAPGAHSTATVSPAVVDSAIQRAGIRTMERAYGKLDHDDVEDVMTGSGVRQARTSFQ
jgi:hypothetical protein